MVVKVRGPLPPYAQLYNFSGRHPVGLAWVHFDGRSSMGFGGSKSVPPLKSQVEVVGNTSFAEVLVGSRKFLALSSSLGVGRGGLGGKV